MQRIKEIYKKLIKKSGRKTVFLAAAGIALLLAGSLTPQPAKQVKTKTGNSPDMEEVRKKTEKELEVFLNKIEGVSDADVMIAYRDSGSVKFGKNIKSNSSQGGSAYDSQIVMKRSGGEESPVRERDEMPGIKGVAVIARGRAEIAPTVERAVKSALGVEIHKIEVIMNEKE